MKERDVCSWALKRELRRRCCQLDLNTHIRTSRRITSSLKLSVFSILQLSVTPAMSRQCGCYLNRKCSFCFRGWLLSPVWQLFLAGYGMSAPDVSRDCITVTSADFFHTCLFYPSSMCWVLFVCELEDHVSRHSFHFVIFAYSLMSC